MGKVNVSKGHFLVKEKDLIVYRDQGGLEITVQLGGKRSLLVIVGEKQGGDIEVWVLKSRDGCPGCGKTDFHKTYKPASQHRGCHRPRGNLKKGEI